MRSSISRLLTAGCDVGAHAGHVGAYAGHGHLLSMTLARFSMPEATFFDAASIASAMLAPPSAIGPSPWAMSAVRGPPLPELDRARRRPPPLCARATSTKDVRPRAGSNRARCAPSSQISPDVIRLPTVRVTSASAPLLDGLLTATCYPVADNSRPPPLATSITAAVSRFSTLTARSPGLGPRGTDFFDVFASSEPSRQ